MVCNAWKWMSRVSEHWLAHPQPHMKIKVSCLLHNCIIASVTDLVLIGNKLWILYADLVNGVFTNWIYLCSLIGGCLEKLAEWKRVAQGSHFSARAGVVKRKAGCLAGGVWGLGGWGCTGLGPLPSPLRGGLYPGHTPGHEASLSWLPGWVGGALGLGIPDLAPHKDAAGAVMHAGRGAASILLLWQLHFFKNTFPEFSYFKYYRPR